MSIVGFNFTKMNVEKKDVKRTGKVEVANNVLINNIEQSKFINSPDQIGLKYDFVYESKYDPEFGHIKLVGNLVSLEKKDEGEKLLHIWEKEKKMSKELMDTDVMRKILNTILAKTNVQALILSKDVNLPSPIPLPKVNVEKKD